MATVMISRISPVRIGIQFNWIQLDRANPYSITTNGKADELFGILFGWNWESRSKVCHFCLSKCNFQQPSFFQIWFIIGLICIAKWNSPTCWFHFGSVWLRLRCSCAVIYRLEILLSANWFKCSRFFSLILEWVVMHLLFLAPASLARELENIAS